MGQDVPPLVNQALLLAEQMTFQRSCIAEVGRLLQLLAGTVQHGTIAEIGTGCGVSAAWLISAMRPGVRLLSIDNAEARVAAVRDLFADHANVTVLCDDWRAVLAYGPFDLLFVDGGTAKSEPNDDLAAAVGPHGIVMLDDLTPVDAWPVEWQGRSDPVRTFWLRHPSFVAVEIGTAPGQAAIIARRQSS